MDRGQADALVSQLGEELGIAGLTLDEGGSCTLFVDEGATIVTLGHNPGFGVMDLMICLDAIAPADAPLLAQLMRANFAWRETGGATFAVEPVSGTLVVQQRLAVAEAAEGGLKSAVERLVATAEAWTRRLSQPQEDGNAAAIDPSRPPPGFIRA